MVEHHLYCAVAHLGYLAEAYGGLSVLHNQSRWGLPEHARGHTQKQLFDSALRHGEAVFTSLCSSLDACSMLVWRDPKAKPGYCLNEADLWEMRIELPDNPDAASADAFPFDEHLDLLDYCWRTTCTVVRCIEDILPQVYELAMHGQEPSRWKWLTGE